VRFLYFDEGCRALFSSPVKTKEDSFSKA